MPTSLKIDDLQNDCGQYLDGQRHCSPQAIMVEARDRFIQEALASWDEFTQSGKHLTGEEARAWLATWGTADERSVPECHE